MVVSIFNLGVRFGLVAFFIYSGLVKLTNITGFYLVLQSYQIIESELFFTIIAYSLPLIEVSIGLLLLFSKSQKLGAIAAITVMVLFVAILSLKWGETLEYGCGCFGLGETEVVGLNNILKNIIPIPFLIHVIFIKEDFEWIFKKISHKRSDVKKN